MKPKLLTCLKCGAARKFLFAYLDEVDIFRIYKCQKCGFIQHAPMCVCGECPRPVKRRRRRRRHRSVIRRDVSRPRRWSGRRSRRPRP